MLYGSNEPGGSVNYGTRSTAGPAAGGTCLRGSPGHEPLVVAWVSRVPGRAEARRGRPAERPFFEPRVSLGTGSAERTRDGARREEGAGR